MLGETAHHLITLATTDQPDGTLAQGSGASAILARCRCSIGAEPSPLGIGDQMGYFSSQGPSDDSPSSDGPGDPAREAESWARIESGGIPVSAERRLQGLAVEGATFSSGLSVNEFALLNRLGPRPLAQVMGASIFQVGWQYLPALEPQPNQWRRSSFDPAYVEPNAQQKQSYRWSQTIICELDTITRAWDQARRRALDRLTEEAVQVGADAVVGVTLRRSEHDWTGRTIDYLVSGTAIRWKEKGDVRWPTLSDLSVQDFWLLLESGFEPVGLIATTTVMFVSASQATRVRRLQTTMQTQELEELGRAFHSARDTVRARLQGQTDAHNGIGAVGMTMSHEVREQELAVESSTTTPGWQQGQLGLPAYSGGKSDLERTGMVITMHGAGTAIKARSGPGPYPAEAVMRLRPSPR